MSHPDLFRLTLYAQKSTTGKLMIGQCWMNYLRSKTSSTASPGLQGISFPQLGNIASATEECDSVSVGGTHFAKRSFEGVTQGEYGEERKLGLVLTDSRFVTTLTSLLASISEHENSRYHK
jgi:hypothetical protein